MFNSYVLEGFWIKLFKINIVCFESNSYILFRIILIYRDDNIVIICRMLGFYEISRYEFLFGFNKVCG